MKIYKPNKTYNLINGLVLLLIIFLGLTLPVIVENIPLDDNKLFGLIGFWIIGIIITVVPFSFKLEVGEDYIKSFFLGFCIRNLKSSNVTLVEYGNLFRGGLGYGKGLKGWENVNGRNKYFSYGEKFWGKEAIGDIKQVLENGK